MASGIQLNKGEWFVFSLFFFPFVSTLISLYYFELEHILRENETKDLIFYYYVENMTCGVDLLKNNIELFKN